MSLEVNLKEYLSFQHSAEYAEFFVGPRHTITDPNNLPSPSAVVNESSCKTGVAISSTNSEAFDKAWLDGMHELFLEKLQQQNKYGSITQSDRTELHDFLETGLSNGRQLILQIMICPPGKCFQIHAHPNIESMLTLNGSLHELRSIGPPIEPPSYYYCKPPPQQPTAIKEKNQMSDESKEKDVCGSESEINTKKVKSIDGPSIPFTTLFEKKATVTGQLIVNEIGSVHQSYTVGDINPKHNNVDGFKDVEDEDNVRGVAMLVLWSGCHANTHPSRVFTRDNRLRLFVGKKDL